jgi:hypothetical protein
MIKELVQAIFQEITDRAVAHDTLRRDYEKASRELYELRSQVKPVAAPVETVAKE